MGCGVIRKAGRRSWTRGDFWVDLVKLFERGRFDNVFIADVLGVDPAYKGAWDTYVNEAVQIPVNDSSTLIGALIHATEKIGLTFTEFDPAGPSVQLRAPCVDARSSEQRADRLEYRHQRQP